MNKNISSQISRLDQEALQQQQLLYQQDFQISALERKMARLQGEKTIEEEKEVAEKIAGLRHELQKHIETQTLLTTQLRRVEVGKEEEGGEYGGDAPFFPLLLDFFLPLPSPRYYNSYSFFLVY